jgi:hypothetical protein
VSKSRAYLGGARFRCFPQGYAPEYTCLYSTELKKFASDKHSSLFCPFEIIKKNIDSRRHCNQNLFFFIMETRK